MRHRLSFLFLSFVLLSTFHLQAQKDEITKIFLVRHAEKVKDGTKDPELSTTGKQRAESLKSMLQKVDMTAIYSTNFKRTKNTAKPIADDKSLAIQLYNPMDSRKFLDGILEKHTGKNVLIVGHSNTIPLLVNTLLGEQKFEQLEDSEYSNLFIVTIVHGTDAEVIQLTFEP